MVSVHMGGEDKKTECHQEYSLSNWDTMVIQQNMKGKMQEEQGFRLSQESHFRHTEFETFIRYL